MLLKDELGLVDAGNTNVRCQNTHPVHIRICSPYFYTHTRVTCMCVRVCLHKCRIYACMMSLSQDEHRTELGDDALWIASSNKLGHEICFLRDPSRETFWQ